MEDEKYGCGSCKREVQKCVFLEKIQMFICPDCCLHSGLRHWQKFAGTGEVLHYVLRKLLTPKQVQAMHTEKVKKTIERVIWDLLPKLNCIYWTGNSSIILRTDHTVDIVSAVTPEVEEKICEACMMNLYEVHGFRKEYSPKTGSEIIVRVQLLMGAPEKIAKWI